MRRWVHVPFVVCCLAVLSSTVTVAQNTKQLFQPINVQDSANLGLPGVATWTPGATTQDDAKPFQSMSVLLSCPADNSGTASLSGDNGTGPNVGQSLIVDNFIRIQTNQSATPQDILSATSAYSGQNVYPASNAIPYLHMA